ncbi:MAG: Kelch repeat-containing protein [Puniceicoccaceae bacterium]
MNKYLLPILLYLFIFISFGSAAGKWTLLDVKGAPTARHETAFVEVDGMFYLIGGREAQGRIDRLNPRTLEWTTMKAQSPLIHHFQPVVVDGKIWMVGAMTGKFPAEPPMERIHIYDPKADKWIEGSPMPEGRRRGSAGTVVYDGKIYMACGIELGHIEGTNGWFDVYDPQTDTWSQLPDAPHVRDHFHAVVLDDKLYCIGGRNTSMHEKGNLASLFKAIVYEVDVYDFKTGKWSTMDKKTPLGSAAGGTAVLDGKIVYFGGEDAEVARNETWILDPETGSWTQAGSLNQGRHGSQAIVYGNAIYIAAGSPKRGGGKIDSVEKFQFK